jgi:hypothetical protein
MMRMNANFRGNDFRQTGPEFARFFAGDAFGPI